VGFGAACRLSQLSAVSRQKAFWKKMNLPG
jgi:hypothetical protein